MTSKRFRKSKTHRWWIRRGSTDILPPLRRRSLKSAGRLEAMHARSSRCTRPRSVSNLIPCLPCRRHEPSPSNHVWTKQRTFVLRNANTYPQSKKKRGCVPFRTFVEGNEIDVRRNHVRSARTGRELCVEDSAFADTFAYGSWCSKFVLPFSSRGISATRSKKGNQWRRQRNLRDVEEIGKRFPLSKEVSMLLVRRQERNCFWKRSFVERGTALVRSVQDLRFFCRVRRSSCFLRS